MALHLLFLLAVYAPSIILANPHNLVSRQYSQSSSNTYTLSCLAKQSDTPQYYASEDLASRAIDDFCSYATGIFKPGTSSSATQSRRFAGINIDNTSAYPIKITAEWSPSAGEDEAACPTFDFKGAGGGDKCKEQLQRIVDGCSNQDVQTALPVRGGSLRQDCMLWTLGVGAMIEAYTEMIPDLSQ